MVEKASKRRIIPPPPRGPQPGQIGGLDEVDLYLSILAVPFTVRRRIAQNVLVVERPADLGDRIGEIVEIVDREHSPTSLLRDFGQRFHAAGGDHRANNAYSKDR